jgi:hypothetical protein
MLFNLRPLSLLAPVRPLQSSERDRSNYAPHRHANFGAGARTEIHRAIRRRERLHHAIELAAHLGVPHGAGGGDLLVHAGIACARLVQPTPCVASVSREIQIVTGEPAAADGKIDPGDREQLYRRRTTFTPGFSLISALWRLGRGGNVG